MNSKINLSRFRETLSNLGLSILVGILAGLGAVVFRAMINSLQSIFFDGGAHALSFLGHFYVIFIPALGGLLVGLVVYFFAREARGNGVPEVMKAMAVEHGRIRPVVMAIKPIASALCIGSGGSAGREGPIVQIGASLSSAIGQFLRLSDDRLRILVVCGAAGGIAATFNAPLAGALFALEIILRRVITPLFAYIFLSAITAKYVASFFLGDKPFFTVPPYHLVSPVEIALYAVLGLIAGLVAIALIRTLYGVEDLFKAVRIPEYLKPALGGIAIGLIGLYNFNLFGLGYGEIEKVLTTNIPVSLLISLCILKIITTSFTLGSGGSGGIFSPSLFIGAMLGTSLAVAFRAVLPVSIGPPGAYGIVAMAALFGAATRAPLTAVIIVFEMTGDYQLILPLMAAVSISTAVSTLMSRGTIYTTRLLREGIDLDMDSQAR